MRAGSANSAAGARSTTSLPVAGDGICSPESLQHMQELFELLPRLKLDSSRAPDPPATDAAVLRAIAEHAQASAAAINLGMPTVGSLNRPNF